MNAYTATGLTLLLILSVEQCVQGIGRSYLQALAFGHLVYGMWVTVQQSRHVWPPRLAADEEVVGEGLGTVLIRSSSTGVTTRIYDDGRRERVFPPIEPT